MHSAIGAETTSQFLCKYEVHNDSGICAGFNRRPNPRRAAGRSEGGGAEHVYAEKISGAKSDRPQLAKLLKSLAEGDTVVVTRLDRLARSTRDLLNILHAIGKAGATFKSLADAWADTKTPHGRLMLTILGGLAEFERELIKARTDDGRKRA